MSVPIFSSGIEASVLIGRPVEQVFAFVSNPLNDPEWAPAHRSVEQVGTGPVVVGTVFRYTGQGGHLSEQKVAALEPNRRFELSDGTGKGFRTTFTFAPESGGTRVTIVCALPAAAQSSFLARMAMGLALGGVMRKGLGDMLGRLKTTLESGAAAAPGGVTTRAVSLPAAAAPGAMPAAPAPETTGERFATGFLVAANLVPLAGVFGFGWDVGAVVLLYWCENIIAGFYTVLRLATASGPFLAKAGMIPFFIFHYGMFCTVHGVFVVSIFHLEKTLGVAGGGFNALLLFEAAARVPGMKWPLLALSVSHCASLIENHFVRGERRTADLGTLMMRPYGRMIALHIAIILGGFLAMAMGSPAGVLVVLVLIKLGIDVATHRRWVKK